VNQIVFVPNGKLSFLACLANAIWFRFSLKGTVSTAANGWIFQAAGILKVQE